MLGNPAVREALRALEQRGLAEQAMWRYAMIEAAI
jgi:DNA-binding FadR family transcriptional regulator